MVVLIGMWCDVRLFCDGEGSVPKDNPQGEGDKAGEEIGLGVTLW